MLVVGLALVLLVLVFRSILVPLVGVLGFLLTIGASLGATVAVFQWGWLSDAGQAATRTGPLLSLTPILVIGILFGLAMDYQVFLVSRIHEAHSHGDEPLERDPHRLPAGRAGGGRRGRRSCSRSSPGFVPGGDATIKSIAFALAIGIVFDAFVVRMVLVPAALALLGARGLVAARAGCAGCPARRRGPGAGARRPPRGPRRPDCGGSRCDPRLDP